MRADVRRVDEARRSSRRVEDELGPIDILVNNAGSLVKRQPIAELTEEIWDEIMDLNLKSAAFCSRAAIPGMIARKKGAIVNMVSIAGRNGGGPGAGPYSTSKGGLITFTKSLAKEMAPHGVRVNAVSPGVIDTPFHEQFSDSRDDCQFRAKDSARPDGDVDGMRDGDRVSGVGRGGVYRRRNGRGQRRTVDVVS